MKKKKKDLLERAFGPDPDNVRFPPFDESKVIPCHRCEWIETSVWGSVFIQCPVCKSQPPADMSRSEP